MNINQSNMGDISIAFVMYKYIEICIKSFKSKTFNKCNNFLI